MILNNAPAKILVDERDYNALLTAAQAALDLLKEIQEQEDPLAMPWPEIDDLERAIWDNLKKAAAKANIQFLRGQIKWYKKRYTAIKQAWRRVHPEDQMFMQSFRADDPDVLDEEES